MQLLPCLIGLLLVVMIGAIFSLGWSVLRPLGKIRTVRVTSPRFQLLDLFWLVILLQPSLTALGWMMQNRYLRSEPGVMVILVLVWGATVAAWYGMTGALSKAGVTSAAKRAVAVLIILPMVGLLIPFVVVTTLAVAVGLIAGENPYEGAPRWVIVGHILLDISFIGAMFGCRRLSQWVAKGAAEDEEVQPLS